MEKSSPTKPVSPDDPRLQQFCGFAGLGEPETSALLRLTDSVSFAAGDRIVHTGEAGHCMYVLLEGRAEVSVERDGHKVVLSELSAGDFFGEVALVDDGPRSADVIALEPCVLLRITRMTIGVLGGTLPDAAIQLLGAIGRALVGRLRSSNQKYLDILLRSGVKE